MASVRIDLAPFVVDGWDTTNFYNSAGYYIHRGIVYLEGTLCTIRAFDDTAVPATRNLLQGLPLEILPASSIALTVIVDIFDSDFNRDGSALEIADTYAAHINPDGTLTLDADPPLFVNTTPSIDTYYFKLAGELGSPKHARYERPLQLVLDIGSLRWPLPGITPPDLTDPAIVWNDIDFTASDFTSSDGQYAIHGSRIHLRGHATASIDGAENLIDPMPVPAEPPDGLSFVSVDSYPLDAYTGAASVIADTDIAPSGDSPPLSIATPAYQRNQNTSRGIHPYPWYQNQTDFATQDDGTVIFGESWGEPPGDTLNTFDFGDYTCGTNTCIKADTAGSTQSFDLAFLVNAIQPQPDWLLILFAYDASSYLPGGNTCVSGDCGPNLDPDPSLTVTIDGLTPFIWETGVSPATASVPNSVGSIGGFLGPPSGQQLYSGNCGISYWPGNTSPSADSIPPELFWQFGQIPFDTVEFTWSLTGHSFQVQAIIEVFPYWNQRQKGIHSGDVITLDGSGWVDSTPDIVIPTLPSSINPGPSTSGIVPLGQ